MDYLHPIYHSVNSYPNIVTEGFISNVEVLSKNQLFDKLLPIIKSILQQEQKDAIRIYQENLDTGSVSDSLSEILKASHDGRIEILFVSVNKQSWVFLRKNPVSFKFISIGNPEIKIYFV